MSVRGSDAFLASAFGAKVIITTEDGNCEFEFQTGNDAEAAFREWLQRNRRFAHVWSNPMKKGRMLLRNREKRQWLSENGMLVTDISAAVEVTSIVEAMRLCAKYECWGVDLILKFDGEELILPLDPEG